MRPYHVTVPFAQWFGPDKGVAGISGKKEQSRPEPDARIRKEVNMAKRCTHLDQIHDVTPSANGCEDCLKTGDTWVHLRLCLTCGHVGCCDSSKNKHATKHFHATNHPVMRSFERGEDWGWCYVDEVMLEFG
jgi:uncharacterized UBP type Zn finger protein